MSPQIQSSQRSSPALLSQSGRGGNNANDSTSRHTVAQGDTLSKLAAKYGVSSDALIKANPQILNPNMIYPGDKVNVPASQNQYTVKPGDTLNKIAAEHGVSTQALADANRISNPNEIFPGDKLRMPAAGTNGASATSSAKDSTGAAATAAANQTISDPNASPATLLKDPRVRAFLDTIGFAEGTGKNYGKLVNGTVISSKTNPSLVGQKNVSITDLSRHPDTLVRVAPGLNSTAAGRYQFLTSTWNGVAGRLGLKDFSARSQDLAAVQLMKDRGMIAPLLKGDVKGAIIKGAPEWASLPQANGQSAYGQGAKSFAALDQTYKTALQQQQASGPTSTGGTAGSTPSSSSNLARGATGPEVTKLQDKLVSLGYMTRAEIGTGPGTYGPRTEAAVKRFQSDNNIQQTGVVGPQTAAALKTAKPVAPGSSNPAGTQWPVPGSRAINKADKPGEGAGEFGTPRSNASGRHSGLDIQGKVGDRVDAFRDGKVLYAGPAGTLGNVVVVDHGNGIHSAYAHLNSLSVREGQSVAAGAQLGGMGRTGNTPSGGDTHLHFEVRTGAGNAAFNASGFLSGTAVDPLKYVKP
jgi:spore coat assembly protein SafA